MQIRHRRSATGVTQTLYSEEAKKRLWNQLYFCMMYHASVRCCRLLLPSICTQADASAKQPGSGVSCVLLQKVVELFETLKCFVSPPCTAGGGTAQGFGLRQGAGVQVLNHHSVCPALLTRLRGCHMFILPKFLSGSCIPHYTTRSAA